MRNVGKTQFNKTVFPIHEQIMPQRTHDVMTISLNHVPVEVGFSDKNTMIIKLRLFYYLIMQRYTCIAIVLL